LLDSTVEIRFAIYEVRASLEILQRGKKVIEKGKISNGVKIEFAFNGVSEKIV